MSQSPFDIGPLESLLSDAAITAIHISESAIYYEKAGGVYPSDIRFESDDQLRQVSENITAAGNAVLSDDNPVVDCVLADGTRVHAERKPFSMSLHKPG